MQFEPGGFDALARALGDLGLNVLLTLAPDAFDAACVPVGLTLDQLLPGGQGALIVGSGGGAFFDRFAAGGPVAPERDDGAPDPLDRYTRRVVEQIARDLLGDSVRFAVAFPFRPTSPTSATSPTIPFQRLGRAAGLGGPSPLGLQTHPVYGPWWAYRALIVVDRTLPASAPPGDGCAGCDAPCVAACPVGAVVRSGFDVPACHGRRLATITDNPCRLSCAARIACIRGPEHRYRDEALAFHMAASMPRRI